MSRPPASPRSSIVNREAAAKAVEAFLEAIGRDKSQEPELEGTGARVAEMFVDELCRGYSIDTRALVESSVIQVTDADSPLVIVRDVPVVTMCPHHLLPSIGTATVAFHVLTKIVGLGTVVSLVDAHARRFTLQEQLGGGVVSDLASVLGPVWVGCRIVLAHGCMIARGERSTNTRVETVTLRAPPERVVEAHQALGVGDREGEASR